MNDTSTETLEAEYTEYIDYTEQLDDMSQRLEELTESTALIEQNVLYLQYLPHIYNTVALLLGVVIVFILFRGLVNFIGRVFGDNTKL